MEDRVEVLQDALLFRKDQAHLELLERLPQQDNEAHWKGDEREEVVEQEAEAKEDLAQEVNQAQQKGHLQARK